MDFRTATRERVVIYDGATGTSLQRLGLTADDFGGAGLEGCNEILNVTRPDAVRDLHRSFLEVGVDVIDTNTFGAFAVPLGEYGVSDRSYELSRSPGLPSRDTTLSPGCVSPTSSRPVDSPDVDVAAFHIVTMGERVNGLGAEMAEYWHHRIRNEWGFADEDGPSLAGLFRQQYRGGRYSWGYPACPNLADNVTVPDLLDANRIGVEVSEATGFQYHPEQTTSAVICHHPQAKNS